MNGLTVPTAECLAMDKYSGCSMGKQLKLLRHISTVQICRLMTFDVPDVVQWRNIARQHTGSLCEAMPRRATAGRANVPQMPLGMLACVVHSRHMALPTPVVDH